MHLTLPVAGSSIALVITAMRARRAAGGGALVMPSDGVIASLEDAQAQLARAREVVAARKEADHVRVAKTREMAYVTLFYVPAGRDWRVDFGGRAWCVLLCRAGSRDVAAIAPLFHYCARHA